MPSSFSTSLHLIMKKSHLILILLVSCALLCGTAQAVTLRINVADDSTGEAIADASIYIDGNYIGKTASDGTYSYVHSSTTDLYLKVVKKGYRDWVDYVDYDATRVYVDMIPEDLTLTVELYDATTLEPIVGAVVRVESDDYSDSDVSGSSGSVNFAVKAGEVYNVEVRASGYADLSKTVEMESSDRTVQYLLFPSDILGIRVVDAGTSAPIEGAEVYVDNTLAGKTDADGGLQLHLERAKRYTFRITATDYQPYQETIYLDEDDVFLGAKLSKSAYSVSIAVFDEATKPVEGAEVYLNGTLKGRTSQYGRFTLSNLPAGTYEIMVRASGYADWSETRRIAGEGEEIVVELGYDRADVTFSVKDADRNALAGATIVIDGQAAGVTDSQGLLTRSLVTNRVYNVTAAHDGYRNISVEADIPPGTTEFSVPLVMEREFNIWVPLVGIGIVIVLLIAVVVVLRRRRSSQRKGRSRGGRDSL